jgi:lipid-binding SYLF domain-containing protein
MQKMAIFLMSVVLFGSASVPATQSKLTKRVNTANDVLMAVMKIPEKTIPQYLFRNAAGVAIIPGVIKGAFLLGGRWGKGILLIQGDDNGWSNPCFITLTGGSFGLQFGGQSTDLVMIFKTPQSIEGIGRGTFTLGADASVAAGPVGRNAEASTNAQLKAEIYSYSRVRGLFAGISLEGANLGIDKKANERFYEKPGISADSILAGTIANPPPGADQITKTLAEISVERPRVAPRDSTAPGNESGGTEGD